MHLQDPREWRGCEVNPHSQSVKWKSVALLLLTTGCPWHAVTVLAPVSDVPKGTHVVAVISPGQVTQLPSDATLQEGVIVDEHKTILTHLSPTDKVAVDASGGEDFGDIHVRRKIGYDLLVFAGLALIVGGGIASNVAATQCNAASTRGHALDEPYDWGCVAIGLVGVTVALAGGVALIVFGRHGELTITTSGLGGRF